MSSLCFEIISLFPKTFDALNNMGVISKAIQNELISINIHDLRSYGIGSYNQVDDVTYGGGAGMLLKPEPIYDAFDAIKKSDKSLTLLMTPQGKALKQNDFVRWTNYNQVIIICGQYEGFDERIREIADEEVSVGDYILTGGEIPAISIVNGLTRLLPGTLGDPESLLDESYNESLLEYPQYTRPRIYRGMKVPEVLLSGNHKEIKKWREEQRLKRTIERRNDLISKQDFKKLPESKRIEKDYD